MVLHRHYGGCRSQNNARTAVLGLAGRSGRRRSPQPGSPNSDFSFRAHLPATASALPLWWSGCASWAASRAALWRSNIDGPPLNVSTSSWQSLCARRLMSSLRRESRQRSRQRGQHRKSRSCSRRQAIRWPPASSRHLRDRVETSRACPTRPPISPAGESSCCASLQARFVAEFERSIIQERVRAGLRRAKSEGKRLGRPPIAPVLERRIREALNEPGRTEGVRKIAARFGVDPSTVQRISRPFDDASIAAAQRLNASLVVGTSNSARVMSAL